MTDASGKSSQDPATTSVLIENITDDKVYHKVGIILLYTSDIVTGGNVSAFQPGWEGPEPWTLGDHSLSHQFPTIQPGDRFEIKVDHRGNELPRIRLNANNDAVLLCVPGLLTTIVKYHYLVSVLFLAVVGVSAVSLHSLAAAQNNSRRLASDSCG